MNDPMMDAARYIITRDLCRWRRIFCYGCQVTTSWLKAHYHTDLKNLKSFGNSNFFFLERKQPNGVDLIDKNPIGRARSYRS